MPPSQPQRPDRRAEQLEWHGLRSQGGRHRPVSDPTSSVPGAANPLGAAAGLIRGVVVDAPTYLHAYKVFCEGLARPLICCALADSSFTPIGGRRVDSYAPGTAVWVARPAHLPYGVIVGAEPPPNADPALAMGDRVHMTSRCGRAADAMQDAILRSRGAGGLVDWSARRPVDSLPGVDRGWMAETGVRILMDSFHAQVAADEAAGLFVFHHDQFVRLAAANLQVFSAGHLEEHLDDEGEILIRRGWTPYPWEQRGALRPEVDPIREVSDAELAAPGAALASREPSRPDQEPFHRRLFLGGYAGQGGKDLVLVPPKGPDVFSKATPDDPDLETPAAAVAEEHRTLAGGWHLRAARGLHLAKQGAIPAPIRRKNPEDRSGDSPDGYKASGYYGDGPDHKVAPAVRTNVEDSPSLQRAAAVLDQAAHRRNWEGLQALHAHGRDWTLPEEGDSPLAAGHEPADPALLADAHALPDPPTAKVEVDHRYGEVEYHTGEAGVYIGDDGAVVIRDAWGSAIVMAGGHVEVQPAGDLFLRPGRSLHAWAGRDFNLRARRHVELSCSDGDLRLKAERNLQALAGNSGEGALLLESRGADAMDYAGKVGTDALGGGVQIKAAAGSVQAWGGSLYLRSLSGGVTLDAAKGSAPILELASRVERYARDGFQDDVGPPSNVAASFSFDAAGARLGGGLAVSGAMTAGGGATVRGDVSIVGGHVFSDRAATNPQVSAYADPAYAASVRARAQDSARAAAGDAKDASGRFKDAFGAGLHAPGGPGDDDAVAAAGFSFRTTEQCGAANFVCWEASWQQASREAGGTLSPWAEPPVESQGAETAPFPGAARLLDEEAFLVQKLSLYDVKRGVAADRGDPARYEDPEFEPVEPRRLGEAYTVVPPPTPPDAAGDDQEGGEDGD